MTRRVKQHEIEDISRAKFQLALPRNWVYRDKPKDYGVDGEIEIFDEDGKPLGLVFWFQLKATESSRASTILNVSLKIETLKYFKALDVPVLLVRYSGYDDTIYSKWVSNVDLFLAKDTARTFNIKLSEEDKWTETSSQELIDYLSKIRVLKSGSFKFPLPISISINDIVIREISKGVLQIQIQKELKRYSDYIQLVPLSENLVDISLTADELKISLMELSGSSFHNIALRNKENFVEDLVKDILLGISFSLINLNHTEYGANIIFENNLESRLLERHDLLEYLIVPLFNSSYFEELLKLVERILLENENANLYIITQLILLYERKTENKKKNLAIERFLKARIENAKLKRDNQLIGISYYNTGNYYSRKERFLNAISNYNLARKYAPIYLKQSYFFSEIASILFNSHRYKSASKFYSISLELKDDIQILGCYGDSLMFSGNYEDALTNFNTYLKNTKVARYEFILKRNCLNYFISKYRIFSQLRDTAKANQYVDSLNPANDSIIEDLEEAFKIDLLCGLAWFNLGITHSNMKNNTDASLCFAMSGMINDGDIESWRNATISAFDNCVPKEIFTLIILTAYELNPDTYLEDLYLYLESHFTPEAFNRITENLNSILPKENQNQKPTIRILNDNGLFESIEDSITKRKN